MDAEKLVVDKSGKILLGTTTGGKELYYAAKNGKSVRFIVFGDGGELPAMLQGGFSSVHAAHSLVQSYLAKAKAPVKQTKGKK